MKILERNQGNVGTTHQATPAKIDKHPRQPARTPHDTRRILFVLLSLPLFFLFNEIPRHAAAVGMELTKKVTPKLPNASSITATMAAAAAKERDHCGFAG